jgi:hypothetical protein
MLKENIEPNAMIKTEVESVGSTLRKKYKIDFAGKNFQRYCIFASCPLSLKL